MAYNVEITLENIHGRYFSSQNLTKDCWNFSSGLVAGSKTPESEDLKKMKKKIK